MSIVFDILSWICLVSGSIFAVIGGIGIVRLPDFYARLHGAGITDTMGAGLLVLGLMFQSIKVGVLEMDGTGPWLITGKLVMVLAFLMITSPTACHALAQAAMTDGLKPDSSDDKDDNE